MQRSGFGCRVSHEFLIGSLVVKTSKFWVVADCVDACESMEFAFLNMQFDGPGTYEVNCDFLPWWDQRVSCWKMAVSSTG
jgi:hypothetical protein